MPEEKVPYKDQSYTEIYDRYDLYSGEPVPTMILNARVLNEKEKYGSRIVHIDYPDDGYFTLNGRIGNAHNYEEAGKKAFVRGGFYAHPEKGWQCRLVEMDPYDYVDLCAQMFSERFDKAIILPEELIQKRLKDYDLEEVFGMGGIFPPGIDFFHKGQEGLHRAIYAITVDIPVIPVIIIEEKKQ
jgi:hypothetical protein